jgi:hypothetical protein
MEVNPGGRPGHDPCRPRPRPTRGNPDWLAWFRVPPFLPRPQSNFAHGRRQVDGLCGPRAVGTVCYRGFSQECVSSDSCPRSTSITWTSGPARRAAARESPAARTGGRARRSRAVAAAAARQPGNWRKGGEAGTGRWCSGPRPRGPATTMRAVASASGASGSLERTRTDRSRRARRPPHTGTCFLRRLRGSARILAAGSGVVAPESGVSG